MNETLNDYSDVKYEPRKQLGRRTLKRLAEVMSIGMKEREEIIKNNISIIKSKKEDYQIKRDIVEREKIQIKKDTTINGEFIIAGIGIEPNTKIAEEAGLLVENGILVDEHCRTNDPNIFAAGDCASFIISCRTCFMNSDVKVFGTGIFLRGKNVIVSVISSDFVDGI